MKVVIVGVSSLAYIFGSLFTATGAQVEHFLIGKKHFKFTEDDSILINLDHYYVKNGNFERIIETKRLYQPKVVDRKPTSVDLFVFSGCYDQVITQMKKISVAYPSFSTTKCLIQVKSWKSIEYLKTMLLTNPVYWISTMVEGYFVNTNERREIKGMFIKKNALQIDSPQYREAVDFALFLSEILKIDLFEVENILQPNRVFISLYAPMVLYILKFTKHHWKGDLKPLKYLSQYYREVQPFLYDHILNNGPFKEVREFSNIYIHDDKKIYALISSILSKPGNSVFKTLVQSALYNKYELDEAIDLATEMIRWYKYFGLDVMCLKRLFADDRIIWQSAIKRDYKLNDAGMPKTMLLEKATS